MALWDELQGLLPSGSPFSGGGGSSSLAGGGDQGLFGYLGGEDYDLGSRLAMAAAHLEGNPGVAATIQERMRSRRESRAEKAEAKRAEAEQLRQFQDYLEKSDPVRAAKTRDNPELLKLIAPAYIKQQEELAADKAAQDWAEKIKIAEEGRDPTRAQKEAENQYRLGAMKAIRGGVAEIGTRGAQEWGAPQGSGSEGPTDEFGSRQMLRGKTPAMAKLGNYVPELYKDPRLQAVRENVPGMENATDEDAGIFLNTIGGAGGVDAAIKSMQASQTNRRLQSETDRKLGVTQEPAYAELQQDLQQRIGGAQPGAKAPWSGRPTEPVPTAELMAARQRFNISDLTVDELSLLKDGARQGKLMEAWNYIKDNRHDRQTFDLMRERGYTTKEGNVVPGLETKPSELDKKLEALAESQEGNPLVREEFDEMAGYANTAGGTAQQSENPWWRLAGRFAMSPGAKNAFNAITALSQDEVFHKSGATAANREYERIERQLMPDASDDPVTLDRKWARAVLVQKNLKANNGRYRDEFAQWQRQYIRDHGQRPSPQEMADVGEQIYAREADKAIREADVLFNQGKGAGGKPLEPVSVGKQNLQYTPGQQDVLDSFGIK